MPLMRFSQSLPFGLLDAGAAALATFATGVYAARNLDPSELGVYALFFSIFRQQADTRLDGVQR